ncbi:MAG TPA: Vms1/Ankzf1 family peptidyl-tRNA hydrolase [Streptosporangiaceae bacterium]|nr:Vms1/Ankzf1 family peptidyl-tRNA hydrolase [Streptosporangiaceae bacterium]
MTGGEHMDLDFLRPLYTGLGGYASVYLDTSRDHEEAQREVDVRWRNARERLASAGADPATLNALAEVINDAGQAAPGRAAFGRDGVAPLAASLAAPPRREIARVAPLPHAMPLLAQRDPHIPQLRVTARHDGGEVVVVNAAGREYEEQVAGTGWPVHKVSGGGWSQLRYQRSTEEAWKTNARELAERVTTEAGRIGAGLILVAGDPVARSLLVQQLGSELAAVTVIIDHEIPADSEAAGRAANQAVADFAVRRSRERYEHWRTQQAHGHGVAGLAATMAAFRDGAVAELLLADHPESTATAWIGPGPADLASSAAELTERGVAGPVPDRADAALARAAAMTGAQLYFLPAADPAPEDGICALLRFPAR